MNRTRGDILPCTSTRTPQLDWSAWEGQCQCQWEYEYRRTLTCMVSMAALSSLSTWWTPWARSSDSLADMLSGFSRPSLSLLRTFKTTLTPEALNHLQPESFPTDTTYLVLGTGSLVSRLLAVYVGELSMRVGVGHAQGHVPLTGHPGAVLMTREVPHPHPSPSHPWRRGVVVVQRHDPAEPLRGQGIITSIGLTDTFNSSYKNSGCTMHWTLSKEINNTHCCTIYQKPPVECNFYFEILKSLKIVQISPALY